MTCTRGGGIPGVPALWKESALDEAAEAKLPDVIPYTLDGLPQETLVELARAFCQLYPTLDGLWYLAVQEKHGNAEAFDLDLDVWKKLPRHEAKTMARALDVAPGTADLASITRLLLAMPFNMAMKHRLEVVDANTCIITFADCPSVRAMEKEGKGREQVICEQVGAPAIMSYPKYLELPVEIAPLRLPPRRPGDDTCCQWRVTVSTQARSRSI